MREIFLDLRCLILRREGAVSESRFESGNERVTLLKRREEQESLMIDPSVVDGVLKAMDSQANRRTAHLGETRSLLPPTFRDGIAHDVSRANLSTHCEDKVVHRIPEIKQLPIRCPK